MTAQGPSPPTFDLASFCELNDLDLDDAPDTTLDATPFSGEEPSSPAPSPASFVRLRTPVAPGDPARFWRRLQDEQLNFMVDVVCLEHAVREVERVAPLSRGPLPCWVAGLVDLRGAMSDVLAERAPGSVFLPNAPLGVYLTGLFVWTANVTALLSEVATAIVRGSPGMQRIDWNAARMRLAAASLTYFEGLEEEIHVELDVLDASDFARKHRVEELRAAVDELLSYASWLEKNLRHD